MTALKIHGVPPSVFTWTARLACHEKGIDYELVPTMPSQVAPLNPFHKIPAITHGDLVLFETAAIVRYLDRTFPGPKLWPVDSIGIARCDQWISAVCDSLVNSAMRYMAARFGFLPVPAEMQQKYLDKAREVVPVFDRRLGESRYLAGDALTAADLFLLPLLSYFPDIAELRAIGDAAPNCKRWLREVGARASVKATAPQQRPQLAA
ncbi:MAG: glutathione S-transferase family protein [Alphaproteobacteria bacterium]|nr:glutathione S-transferase family protein [Alphaproteobacteria bacterium]